MLIKDVLMGYSHFTTISANCLCNWHSTTCQISLSSWIYKTEAMPNRSHFGIPIRTSLIISTWAWGCWVVTFPLFLRPSFTFTNSRAVSIADFISFLSTCFCTRLPISPRTPQCSTCYIRRYAYKIFKLMSMGRFYLMWMRVFHLESCHFCEMSIPK